MGTVIPFARRSIRESPTDEMNELVRRDKLFMNESEENTKYVDRAHTHGYEVAAYIKAHFPNPPSLDFGPAIREGVMKLTLKSMSEAVLGSGQTEWQQYPRYYALLVIELDRRLKRMCGR